MDFLIELLSYGVKYILYMAVVVFAIYSGKVLRDKKTAKIKDKNQ